MKRKIGLVAVLFLFVAGGTFAQFAIEGSVSTSFNGITPSIGIGVELAKFDILAGLNFSINTYEYEYANESDRSYSYGRNNIGIYAGLAPKASLPGKWSLSFPLLVQVLFGSREKSDYFSGNPRYINSDDAGSTNFGFDFRAGARAVYAFSNNWGLYTGFLVNMLSWTQNKYDTFENYYPNTRLGYTYNGFGVLNGGVVQLGIIYRFNPSNNTGSTGNTGGSSENDDWW